jgi:hypothetical protein
MLKVYSLNEEESSKFESSKFPDIYNEPIIF